MTSEYPTLSSEEKQPPQWLADRKTWLLWKLEPGEPKPRKMPYWANGEKRHGELGGAEDLAHLVTYAEAKRAAEKRRMRVGLAIVGDLAFVDLDECILEDGPSPLATELSLLVPDALVEVSQSGIGLHVLGITEKKLQVSINRGKTLGFEAYTYGRFCAWTGNLIDTPGQPCNLDPLLEELMQRAETEPRNVVPFSKKGKVSKLMYDNSAEAIGELLERLPNDDWDWDTYFQVLCAVRNELPTPEGLNLFLEWAAKSDKYNERQSRKDWRSIRPRSEDVRRHTAATLVHLLNPAHQPKSEPPPLQVVLDNTDMPSQFDISFLVDTKLPTIEWLVEDLLPPGLTMLAAPAKLGKSYLSMQLAICVAAGKPFMGFKTQRSDVLYLDLESGHQLVQGRVLPIIRGHDINADELRGRFQFALEWGYGEQAVQRIEDALAENENLRLVVVDLFARIRDHEQGHTNKNSYQLDYDALSPLADLAKRFPRVAIIVVHHSNKAKQEHWQDTISGTMGIAGVTHTNWAMLRPAKQGMTPEEQEALRGYAVFCGAGKLCKEFELVLKHMPRDAGWALSELKTWEVTQTKMQEQYLLFMQTKPIGEKFTAREVAEHFGKNRNTVKETLRRMADRGEIGSDTDGYYLLTERKEAKF